MKIVAAPSRQFKTYTMILGILMGSSNSFFIMLDALGKADVLSVKTVLIVNAVLGFLIVPAKLIYQNISATTEQKVDIVASAASQPIKDGEKDVVVKIDKVTVPSTPE